MKKLISFLLSIIKTLFRVLKKSLELLIIISVYIIFYLSRLITLPFRLCFPPKDLMSLSGIDFEHFVAKWMGTKGYRHIKLTPLSSDYGIDITAIKDGVKVGVQCKRYKNKVGISAIQEVTAGLPYYECQKGLVITNSSFSQNAIELADTNGIELIDGKELLNSSTANKLLKKPFALKVSSFMMFIFTCLSVLLSVFVFFYYPAYLLLSLFLCFICIMSLKNSITVIKLERKEKMKFKG